MLAGSNRVNIDKTDREIDTGLPLQSHVCFYLQKSVLSSIRGLKLTALPPFLFQTKMGQVVKWKSN